MKSHRKGPFRAVIMLLLAAVIVFGAASPAHAWKIKNGACAGDRDWTLTMTTTVSSHMVTKQYTAPGGYERVVGKVKNMKHGSLWISRNLEDDNGHLDHVVKIFDDTKRACVVFRPSKLDEKTSTGRPWDSFWLHISGDWGKAYDFPGKWSDTIFRNKGMYD